MKTAPKNLWLWGGLLPVFIIGFDQLTKYLAVKAFKVPMNICALENQPYAHIEVSPIFDFSLVCNRGVSFGLFSGHPEIARVVFTAFAAIMCIVLLVWMSREKSKLMRLSLGLIIGGAIGNAIDRALFGAVTDFLNFQDIAHDKVQSGQCHIFFLHCYRR